VRGGVVVGQELQGCGGGEHVPQGLKGEGNYVVGVGGSCVAGEQLQGRHRVKQLGVKGLLQPLPS